MHIYIYIYIHIYIYIYYVYISIYIYTHTPAIGFYIMFPSPFASDSYVPPLSAGVTTGMVIPLRLGRGLRDLL